MIAVNSSKLFQCRIRGIKHREFQNSCKMKRDTKRHQTNVMQSSPEENMGQLVQGRKTWWVEHQMNFKWPQFQWGMGVSWKHYPTQCRTRRVSWWWHGLNTWRADCVWCQSRYPWTCQSCDTSMERNVIKNWRVVNESFQSRLTREMDLRKETIGLIEPWSMAMEIL